MLQSSDFRDQSVIDMLLSCTNAKYWSLGVIQRTAKKSESLVSDEHAKGIAIII